MRKRNILEILFGLAVLTGFINGCTEDITLDMPEGEEKLVVEGSIENGQPPFVIISRTLPYFAPTTKDVLNSIYISGAHVTVSDGKQNVDLQEVNFSHLPDSLKTLIARYLNLDPEEFSGFQFVFYIGLNMLGEIGKTYTLTVDSGSYHITAVTTIPEPVPIDSLSYEKSPRAPNDSFYILKVYFQDPAGQPNYYRYFTRRNSEPFYANAFNSVFDDQLLDGQLIAAPVPRGQPRYAEIDPERYGLFTIGDTVTLKLCSIDKNFYDFWTTFEYSIFSGGPYAKPAYILSNIEGGLGYWGGYGASFKQIIIQP